jgi:tetratricopeptide (TPR) repeat protein
MRSNFLYCCAAAAVVATMASSAALAQMGGMGGQGGMGRSSGMNQPREEIPSTPTVDKPDAAATKAYTAGMKSLVKARDQEAVAANAPNEDKKNAALEKVNDAYGRALDQFTEALRNKGDMYDAWNKVGYIHLRLGAYGESVDDYNHALALKPDLLEAIEHRAEAYLAVDRLDDAKSAYMDLFNHARPLADQLMPAMRRWLTDHRADTNGMRASDVDAFDKWLQERDGIAKQTAALPP